MASTINGKSRAQIQEELCALFDESDFEQHSFTKRHYLPASVIINRLDKVLGLNYSFEPKELNLWENGSKQNVALIGVITIYDDDGRFVCSRGCGGGHVVICSNSANESENAKKDTNVEETLLSQSTLKEPVNVANDIEAATKDALKRAAKMFGVGAQQLQEKRNVSPGPRVTYSSSPLEEFTVIVKSSFSSVGRDGYSASVDYNGKILKLLIWEAGQKAIANLKKDYSISKFTKECKPGKSLTFLGSRKQYHGVDQLVLEGFNPQRGRS